MPELTCDYLVVGAGATAMAFVDELVHASKEITVSSCFIILCVLLILYILLVPLLAILIRYLADLM